MSDFPASAGPFENSILLFSSCAACILPYRRIISASALSINDGPQGMFARQRAVYILLCFFGSNVKADANITWCKNNASLNFRVNARLAMSATT